MGRFTSKALFEIKTNSNARLFRTKRGDKTFANFKLELLC